MMQLDINVAPTGAQFLRGGFIAAGDFSASLTGGTFSRATGLLCEVQTPGCCGKYTR